MNKLKINRLLIAVLIFVVFINTVSALGVTPARNMIDFSSHAKGDGSFTILNSQKQDMRVVVYVQGELNESVKIKENIISMSSAEESKKIDYSYKLPKELSPGMHKAEMVILQLPSDSASDSQITATVAVITELAVFVQYPGKYAEADVNIAPGENDKEIKFVIPVVNKGKLDIARARANIDIYTKLNEKVDSLLTEPIEIKSNERREIVAIWKTESLPGVYRAVVNLLYDEQTLKIEREFSLGSQVIDLQHVEVKEFQLGQIAKFEMLVENKWSESMKGVYSQTNIFNEKGEVMADFKSPTYDVPSLSKQILVSYWDSEGVHTGTYDASIYLKYGQKSSQKDVKLKISEDKIDIVGLGYVISEKKSGKDGESNTVTILIVVIGILVLLNVVWFMMIRKFMKKQVK